MTTVNISLPDEMKAFVQAQMVQQGYASASAYVRALIRDAQIRRARGELDVELREALESGSATPLTREDWVALRAEAIAGLDRETIPP